MPQITRQLCNLGQKKDILKYYIKYFWFSIKLLLFIKNISNFQEKKINYSKQVFGLYRLNQGRIIYTSLVKLTKISYIGILFKVRFMQDSGLLRVIGLDRFHCMTNKFLIEAKK